MDNVTETREKAQEEIIKEKLQKRDNIIKDIVSGAIYLGVIFILCFLFVEFVAQRTVVSGESMTNTLQNADQLIIDKVSYRFIDPKRYEVIVFPFQYDKKVYYIKRIIGLPGETVQIDKDGDIYINGKQLLESYGKETIRDGGMAQNPITLGDDEYFVLGDNRNGSEDSRFSDVGLIKKEDIIGKALFRIFPNPGFIDNLSNYSDKKAK